jgi:Ser/Thr protein kinase RdoA (MazF antagonist)
MTTLDQTTDLFLSLTPQKVLQAVDAAGVRTAPVCFPLNSFENRVYDVLLEDGGHVVAKFYRPHRWTRQQILEEHAFMADLQADEIPICPHRAFPDGSTLKEQDGILYCLYERRGGRAPEELTDEAVERLGMLTARLHNVGARREAPSRLRLCADTYVREELDWMLTRGVLPDEVRERYVEAALGLADLADEWMEGVPVHRLHGDLHLGNLLLRDGLLYVLDFDDMVVGPAVQDLWLLLPGRDAFTRRQRELFLDAYGQLRAFDRSTLRLIEPLRGLRYVRYAAWLARRWHDPVFPQVWPHFGTPDYWRQETADLEDLLALVRREAGLQAPAPAEPDRELTNADFFWDWKDRERDKERS